MLPMFLAMVDGTIVAAALPAIAGDLGDPAQISWVVIAYLIAATIASPVYGRLGDILGRKRLLAGALIVVIVASLLCALSVNVTMLIAARLLQGFGGGGLMTLSQALIGEAVPPRQRARYGGILAAVAVFSTGFGAVAGGYLTQHLGWRSVFFVGVPVGLLALLLVRRLKPVTPTPQPFRFDAAGLILFIVFITSAMVMFRQVQELDASIILPVLGLLSLSIVAVLLLVWRERRAAHPLFPISLFRDPTIWRSDVLALCHGASLVSLITFLPIYLRVGLGSDSGEIGLSLLPVTAGVPIGSIITGQLIGWTGRTAVFPSFGLVVVVALFAVVALWLPRFDATHLSVILGLIGLFMGTVMGVVQITVQSAAGPGMLGTATASVQFSRSIGAALGTALVGAVLFASMKASNGDSAALFATILQQGPDALAKLPAGQAASFQSEVVNAFRAAYAAIGAFCAVAMVLAWTLPLRRI